LSVSESSTQFKSLCKKAFTGRTFFKKLDDWLHFIKLLTWRFDTGCLENALQEAFTLDSNLFGGAGKQSSPGIFGKKLAVTASTPSGGAFIFTNYNRLSSGNKVYFLRDPD